MNKLFFQHSDDSFVSSTTPCKFPLEDELEMLVQQTPTPSPVPSQVIIIIFVSTFVLFAFTKRYLISNLIYYPADSLAIIHKKRSEHRDE